MKAETHTGGAERRGRAWLARSDGREDAGEGAEEGTGEGAER